MSQNENELRQKEEANMRKNSDERQSTSRGAHPTPNDARTKVIRTRVNGSVGITPVHLARARQPEKKMQCCPYLVPQQFQPPQPAQPSATIRQVYDLFYNYTFGESAPRRLSESTEDNTRKVYGKLAPIHDRQMDDLTIDELQRLLNDMPLGRTMVSKTRLLIRRLYNYAIPRGLCRTNPAQYLVMPDRPEHQHYQDFTDAELATMWKHRRDPIIRMLLIMCYSGFRISAYRTLETDLNDRFFRGGVKTAAGKGRMVPIHSAVLPLVEETLREEGEYLCGLSQNQFNHRMHAILTEIGIDGKNGRHHTPHSCRHTFSRLCESYGVREADRKRMLGHSFGDDITNGVYGHRTLEELREQIEKIRI